MPPKLFSPHQLKRAKRAVKRKSLIYAQLTNKP